MVEIDSFGYINHNSLQYGVALPGSGIRLIIPRDCNEVKAIAAPPIKLSHSRGAAERSLEGKSREVCDWGDLLWPTSIKDKSQG